MADSTTFGGFDKSSLGPVFSGAELPDDDDVLVMHPDNSMEPGMMERLWFNTGAAFSSSAIIGGSYGFVEGMRATGRTTFKLRMNAIINSTTGKARMMGNRVGILAFMVTMFYETALKWREEWHLTEPQILIGSGTATGLLYTSTSGWRHTLGGVLLGTATTGSFYAYRNYMDNKKNAHQFAFPQQ